MNRLKGLVRFWRWLPLVVLTVVSVPLPIAGTPACPAEASTDIVPIGDYCYRFKVRVTNGTGGTLAVDYPLAAEVNAGQLESQGFLDTYGWDLRPVSSGLAAVELTAQDLSSNPARWWFESPQALTDGSSMTMWVYAGAAHAKRDQAFFLNGSESITVSDHADFDYTDDFEIITTVQTSDPTQDAWFATKYDAGSSQGYRFGVIDDSGTSRFRAVIDNQTLDATLSPEWTGAEMKVRMQFNAPDLYVHEWNTTTEVWDQVATVDTGLGGVTATSEDMVFGSSFTGLMREVEIRDGVGGGSYAPVARWGMHPTNITETSASDPSYEGTVQNELNIGTHDGTYSLSRSQASITVTVGPLALATAETSQTVTEQFKDLLGEPTSTDLFAEQTTLERMPFYSMLSSAQTASGLPDDAFWIMVVGGVTGLLAIVVYGFTKRFEIAAAVPTGGFVVGGLVGLFAPWVAAIFGFTALGIGLLARWGRD